MLGTGLGTLDAMGNKIKSLAHKASISVGKTDNKQINIEFQERINTMKKTKQVRKGQRWQAILDMMVSVGLL